MSDDKPCNAFVGDLVFLIVNGVSGRSKGKVTRVGLMNEHRLPLDIEVPVKADAEVTDGKVEVHQVSPFSEGVVILPPRKEWGKTKTLANFLRTRPGLIVVRETGAKIPRYCLFCQECLTRANLIRKGVVECRELRIWGDDTEFSEGDDDLLEGGHTMLSCGCGKEWEPPKECV